MDDEELFMTNEELGLATDELERAYNPEENNPTSIVLNDIRTTNLTAYNFAAERKFKTKVLEWLGNGKPKLFKSPTEGNFIVRIMNVSLSPDDKLSRMLHNFSATTYEIADYNADNVASLIYNQSKEGV